MFKIKPTTFSSKPKCWEQVNFEEFFVTIWAKTNFILGIQKRVKNTWRISWFESSFWNILIIIFFQKGNKLLCIFEFSMNWKKYLFLNLYLELSDRFAVTWGIGPRSDQLTIFRHRARTRIIITRSGEKS